MNEDIFGKYVHRKSRTNFIELKPDGSCVLYEKGTAMTGNYEVNGTDIRISSAGSTSQGKIQNGIIIDAEGEKWLRPGVTDDPLASMTWVPAVMRRDDFPWELIDIAVIVIAYLLLS